MKIALMRNPTAIRDLLKGSMAVYILVAVQVAAAGIPVSEPKV